MPEYTNTEMFNLIDDYIHDARDRRIMKDRLVNGYTYTYLAGKYDLTEVAIRKIINKNKEILFRYLTKAE